VFKLFRDQQLIASDTQFSLLVHQGNKLKNAVGHLVDNYQIQLEADQIAIAGTLGWAKQKQMNSINLVILRLVMLSFGRYFPNLIRKTLQKILITGKQDAPFKFYRRLSWESDHWQVSDQLTAESWDKVIAADIGCDRTSIYVVMSRTFQPGQLQPAWDLSDRLKNLDAAASVDLLRDF
jgi:hypothetical protein